MDFYKTWEVLGMLMCMPVLLAQYVVKSFPTELPLQTTKQFMKEEHSALFVINCVVHWQTLEDIKKLIQILIQIENM